jgi:hypothetical protein
MKRVIREDNRAERRPTPADRWLRQAAERRLRWLRGTLTRGLPRLEFLRRPVTNYSVHHRWERFVFQFYPQIHLTIEPWLREALRPSHSPEAIRRLYTTAAPKHTLAKASTPKSAGIRKFGSLNPRGIREQAHPVSASLDFVGHVRALEQQLRRYATRQTGMGESTLEVALRRLTHQMRRVEEHLTEAPEIVLHGLAPAVVAAEHRAPAEAERFPPAAKAWDSFNQAPRAQPAAAPALDIEQLTDQVIRQIDSRVIAMRERMGRI